MKHRTVFHQKAPLRIVWNLLGRTSVPDDDGRQCSVCAATNANVHIVLNKEAIEIISGQSLVKQFFLDYINGRTDIYPQSKQAATKEALTYTRNLVQHAFSDLDAAFSERPGADDTSTQRFDKTVYLFTHEELEDGQTVFKPNQFTTSFVSLNNRIVLVYAVKNLYEYIALDFYHVYFSSDSIKQVAVCPCCKKA